MAVELLLAQEVQKDVDEAYSWYEDRRAGLGEEFLSCVDACIRAICRMPELHPVVHAEYRRALVRRFPYAVFYEYAGEQVTVYSTISHIPGPREMAGAVDVTEMASDEKDLC
jgi:plasmid stabilization system protein ParE